MPTSLQSIEQTKTTSCLRMYSACISTSWLQHNYGPPGNSQHPSNIIVLNWETFIFWGAPIFETPGYHMSLSLNQPRGYQPSLHHPFLSPTPSCPRIVSPANFSAARPYWSNAEFGWSRPKWPTKAGSAIKICPNCQMDKS